MGLYTYPIAVAVYLCVFYYLSRTNGFKKPARNDIQTLQRQIERTCKEKTNLEKRLKEEQQALEDAKRKFNAGQLLLSNDFDYHTMRVQI